MEFLLEPMRVEHIPAVAGIERLCFSQPWPVHAYRKEIQDSSMAYYEVARVVRGPEASGSADEMVLALDSQQVPSAGVHPGQAQPSPRAEPGLMRRLARLLRTAPELASPELERQLRSIIGYAGLWVMSDEAHVTTIAVHPDFRGRGMGELLLLGLIDRSLEFQAKWMTLEVRVSNQIAQALYRKYTFKEMGVRRGYYSDDHEDALIMWTEPLDSPSFREALESNRARLLARLRDHG